MKIQSINDVITNSSTEIYQEATEYTVKAVKEIINVILKIGGSDKSCDDLFTVSINYENMLEEYFENLYNSGLSEEQDSIIDEVRNLKDKQGNLISDSEAYNELVRIGLVGSVFPTIERFVDNYESDWSYPQTEVSIIPKGEANPKDISILNQINDLFNINSCYNG